MSSQPRRSPRFVKKSVARSREPNRTITWSFVRRSELRDDLDHHSEWLGEMQDEILRLKEELSDMKAAYEGACEIIDAMARELIASDIASTPSEDE